MPVTLNRDPHCKFCSELAMVEVAGEDHAVARWCPSCGALYRAEYTPPERGDAPQPESYQEVWTRPRLAEFRPCEPSPVAPTAAAASALPRDAPHSEYDWRARFRSWATRDGLSRYSIGWYVNNVFFGPGAVSADVDPARFGLYGLSPVAAAALGLGGLSDRSIPVGSKVSPRLARFFRDEFGLELKP